MKLFFKKLIGHGKHSGLKMSCADYLALGTMMPLGGWLLAGRPVWLRSTWGAHPPSRHAGVDLFVYVLSDFSSQPKVSLWTGRFCTCFTLFTDADLHSGHL